jgi:hypothetical protein
MSARVRVLEGPWLEAHPLIVGSTVITMAVMGLAVKAAAGMRGQTVAELVRGETPRGCAPSSSTSLRVVPAASR